MIKLIKSTFYKEKDTKRKLSAFINKTKQLSFGKECNKFEHSFAKWQGRSHAILVNSGSSANLAVVQSLLNLNLVKKGDLVGFSSITWSTNVMPLIQLGLKPISIDIELDTLNVSSKNLLRVLKKSNLKLLFITNLLGFCDDLDKIAEICKKKNIILVEDNCEALGSMYKGKKLGNYGLASTFSFYVGHHLSTIEGGAICSDNTELSKMLKIVRAHGWDRNLTTTEQGNLRQSHNVSTSFYSRYTFYDLGYNLRPTEIQGYIGNLQLRHLDKIVNIRNTNYDRLASKLYRLTDKYHPIKSHHLDILSNFAFPLICKNNTIRKKVINSCNNKIEIRQIVGGNII